MKARTTDYDRSSISCTQPMIDHEIPSLFLSVLTAQHVRASNRSFCDVLQQESKRDSENITTLNDFRDWHLLKFVATWQNNDISLMIWYLKDIRKNTSCLWETLNIFNVPFPKWILCFIIDPNISCYEFMFANHCLMIIFFLFIIFFYL